MKVDWKEMRRRVSEESRQIRERRSERDEKIIKEAIESGRSGSLGRAIMRMGTSGQPRSRIFSQKMTMPKGKQR